MTLVINMINKALLSFYLVIRYFTIMILVLFLIGTYKLENYGFYMIIYYIAINYLAVKYGIIYEIDKNEKFDKRLIFKSASIFLIIFNVGIYMLFRFKLVEVILLSAIPVVELYFIKTKKDKQKIIEENTKKAIEDYFNSKK